MRRAASGLALVVVFLGAFTVLSHFPLRLSRRSESALTVTFRNAASSSDVCREPTPEERAKMLPHMRRDRICERRRASTRMRVLLDGRELLDRSYKPLGLSSDGASLALESFPVAAGGHDVAILVADTETGTGDHWDFRFERRLDFPKDRRILVEFRKEQGFTVH